MDGILADSPFVDFGEDGLLPWPRQPVERIDAETTQQLRYFVRQQVPKTPGVYGMLDVLGRLIYV